MRNSRIADRFFEEQTIAFDIDISDPGSNYPKFTVSKVRHGGSQDKVHVDKFLGVVFKSPSNKVDFWTNIWKVKIEAKIQAEPISSSTFLVAAQLNVSEPYDFELDNSLTFGVNGKLTGTPDYYKKSFVLAADTLPSTTGILKVRCAEAPHPKLQKRDQVITLTGNNRQIQIKMHPGGIESTQIVPGKYTVTADELATKDETYVAPAVVSPGKAAIEVGQSTAIEVTYGPVEEYSAIDVSIGDMLSLKEEKLHVHVGDREFWSPISHTTAVRRLPPSGRIGVGVSLIILNNTRYWFETRSLDVSPKLYEVSFPRPDKTTDVTPPDAVRVSIKVSTKDPVDATVPVRLSSAASGFIYRADVKANKPNAEFPVLVKPDTYKVEATSFVKEGVVYDVQVDSSLAVQPPSATLQMAIRRGANLCVPGFPDFVSFGGCTNLSASHTADFVRARASSLFTYAGVDGGGDYKRYLERKDETKTPRAIKMARDAEAELHDAVLPVLVSYTCNLSLGDVHEHLTNEKWLAHSFANLILSLKIAMENKDESHPVPAGYILNPDFLGKCQKGLPPGGSLPPEFEMPVINSLQEALDNWKVSATIPGSIQNNLGSYVRAVNWLVRTVAPDVTFGWQINLWGGPYDGSKWIYDAVDPATVAKSIADYAASLGVFDAVDNRTRGPDFLAVDRYERDNLYCDAITGCYCYGGRQWDRFFDFCRALSLQLRVPVMPWQIPASRTPLDHDNVVDDFINKQKWGTGGSYMLGDPPIASDYSNVNPKVLELQLAKYCTKFPPTFKDLLHQPHRLDPSSPAYNNFPQRGIFAVLLGDGSTTGIVQSIAETWQLDKLHAYRDNPVRFDCPTRSKRVG